MGHTHKYTVDFGHHKVTALVTDMGADQEPTVELVDSSLYGKQMDPHSLDRDDVINCVLYHHDMMQSEQTDPNPEPFVDAWGELLV